MEPKSSRHFLPWAALAVAILLASPGRLVWAQANAKNSTTIRVTVNVLDPEGKPVPNAGVVLRQESVTYGLMPKHPFNVEIRTDDKGAATVQGFVPGIVLVQVIAHGFQTYGQGFVLQHANEAIHVKLEPPRPQVTIYP